MCRCVCVCVPSGVFTLSNSSASPVLMDVSPVAMETYIFLTALRAGYIVMHEVVVSFYLHACAWS